MTSKLGQYLIIILFSVNIFANEKNEHHSLGLDLYFLGKYECARKEINLAIAELEHQLITQPENIDCLNELGKLYVNINNTSKAKKYFIKTIEIDIDKHAISKLFHIYSDNKDYELGLKTFEELTHLHNTNKEIWLYRELLLKKIINQMDLSDDYQMEMAIKRISIFIDNKNEYFQDFNGKYFFVFYAFDKR